MPAIGIARRLVVPTPVESRLLSWKPNWGRWQVAQATWPLLLKRVSKKSFCPKVAAAGLSPYRFDGSAARGGRLPIQSERKVVSSSLLQVGRSQKKSRSVIDQAAAVIILQHALDSERSGSSEPGLLLHPESD